MYFWGCITNVKNGMNGTSAFFFFLVTSVFIKEIFCNKVRLEPSVSRP